MWRATLRDRPPSICAGSEGAARHRVVEKSASKLPAPLTPGLGLHGADTPFSAASGESLVAEDERYPLYTRKDTTRWFRPAARLITGFDAAAPMDRPQRDLFGRALPDATTRALRLAGTVALATALGVLVSWRGWPLGLVMFSGHTSLAAGVVHVTLIARSRLPTAPPKRR